MKRGIICRTKVTFSIIEATQTYTLKVRQSKVRGIGSYRVDEGKNENFPVSPLIDISLFYQ